MNGSQTNKKDIDKILHSKIAGTTSGKMEDDEGAAPGGIAANPTFQKSSAKNLPAILNQL